MALSFHTPFLGDEIMIIRPNHLDSMLRPFWKHMEGVGQTFPRHKIVDDGDCFRISIDVPGVKIKDLKVELEENKIINVEGSRKVTHDEEGNAVKKARFLTRFSIPVDEMDLAGIKANISDGVLVLTAPKKPKISPVEVNITQKTNLDELDSTNIYRLSLDVPGMRANDIQIKVVDNELIHITGARSIKGNGGKYQDEPLSRMFSVDAKKMNLDKIAASLSDGVLLVSVPMKKTEPVVVPVTSESNEPESTTTVDGFRIALDMPGVKVDDLKVTLTDDSELLRVHGVRKVQKCSNRGNSEEVNIKRSFSVSSEEIEMESLRANLSDGVLVVTADKKPKPKPFVIPVVAENPEAQNEDASANGAPDGDEKAGSGDVQETKAADSVN